MDQRIPSMICKDTDSVVLNLDTNDVLNAPSDGQCLLNVNTSLRNIELNNSRNFSPQRSFDGMYSTSSIFKKRPATCRDAESPLQTLM